MPADTLLERINHALRTGEWWVPAWWQGSHYFESEHFDRGEAERAFLERGGPRNLDSVLSGSLASPKPPAGGEPEE